MATLALLAGLAGLVACGGEGDGSSASGPESRGQRGDRAGRLILLVGIDTLPAARTSTYGYERETTPQLTRIAAQGVRFERALSPSPWTRPAFASIFTGLPPARHRAGEVGPETGPATRPLAPGFVTLAERLRDAGWQTRAWINNPFMVAGSGLEQGFASYVDYGTRSSARAAEPAVRDLVRELEMPQSADRFLFLHLMDPHGAYRMPDDFRARFTAETQVGRLSHPLTRELFGKLTHRRLDPGAEERRFLGDLYDAGVAYTDAQLGRVFDAALAAGPPERLTFVVTADHGEELFEHGGFEHGHTVYDELLRVPLVVVQPGRATAGGLVETAVSTRDLARTLLDAAGVAPLGPGRSLLPLLAGAQRDPERAVASGATLYGVERLAIERDGLKYVYNQTANGRPSRRAPRPDARHELYDLRRDPGETTNRFRSEPQRARALHAELAERFAQSLAESVAVRFDAGSGDGNVRPVLEGFLTLPPGQRFSARVRDYVWPLADGSDAELDVRWDWVFGQHRMRFRTRAPRGVLGFPLPHDAGPVRARFLLDGRPVAVEAVAVGSSERRPAGAHFEVRAEDALAVEEVLREREAGNGGLRIAVGRVPAFPELVDGEAPPADPDLLEQLEALGYLE